MSTDVPPRAWVLPEEPAPVRLMSTIWADPARRHDDLACPSDLDEWLEAVGIPLDGARASEAELAEAVALRDAVRRLAAHVTADTRAAAASAIAVVDTAVAVLNKAARHQAGPKIASVGGKLRLVPDESVSRVRAGLAKVAAESAVLLGGEEAASLRACNAPGCVLYFVKAHPRREWCSVACGNRERAARHYQRLRAKRSDQG